jgi:hypothetical protein
LIHARFYVIDILIYSQVQRLSTPVFMTSATATAAALQLYLGPHQFLLFCMCWYVGLVTSLINSGTNGVSSLVEGMQALTLGADN